MKKLYILFFGWLAFASPAVSSRNRLIYEDRIWEYTHCLGDDLWIEQYCFDGTKMVAGKNYNQWKLIKTISWTAYTETDPVETPADRTVALLREEDGRVYMLLEREKT